MRSTQEVWHDFVHAAIRHVFEDRVTVLSECVGNVVAHAEQLTKEHLRAIDLVFFHDRERPLDGFFVVRGYHDGGLVKVGENGVDRLDVQQSTTTTTHNNNNE